MAMIAHVARHYDIVIIGSGAGGGTMAHALAGTRRAHPGRRARRVRAAGGGELEPGGGLEATCAIARPSAGSTSAASEFLPYTHYCVGGNTKFWGSVLYRLRREDFQARRARRRRLAGLADRLRHAGAVLRSRRAAVSRARRARRRSDRAAARAVSVSADPARARRWRRSSSELRAPGAAPVAAAARPDQPGEPGGCMLCNTCNSFPCKMHAKSDAEVCCVRPALRSRTSRCGPTRWRARLITDPGGTRVEAVEVERDGETCASRRRCSSCRAAPSTRRRCCCARRTTRTRTGWPIRPGWSAAATWRTWRR